MRGYFVAAGVYLADQVGETFSDPAQDEKGSLWRVFCQTGFTGSIGFYCFVSFLMKLTMVNPPSAEGITRVCCVY